LDIGKDAVAAWGASDRQVYQGSEAPPSSSSAAAGGAGTPSEDVQLKTNRYVDEKGEPLPAEGGATKGEFKRMPIRMTLYIDQRKIAKLLVECANSAMPIEVRRVRFKPNEGTVVQFGSQGGGGGQPAAPAGPAMNFGGGGGGGGPAAPAGPAAGHYGPGAGYGGGGYGPAGGGYGPGGPGGRLGGLGGPQRGPTPGGISGVTGGWDKSDMDIPIEIQGIICIYNPPDVALLNKGASSETPAADSAATPAPATETAPAAQPAAPATATPGETPAAKPAETPDSNPAETPDKKPADAPDKKPADAPAAVPATEPAKQE
jgi:hypothetical protein